MHCPAARPLVRTLICKCSAPAAICAAPLPWEFDAGWPRRKYDLARKILSQSLESSSSSIHGIVTQMPTHKPLNKQTIIIPDTANQQPHPMLLLPVGSRVIIGERINDKGHNNNNGNAAFDAEQFPLLAILGWQNGYNIGNTTTCTTRAENITTIPTQTHMPTYNI